jgi:hypothetical protein
MLNLREETRETVLETGECWFCKQSKQLAENMYFPLNFKTARIVRDYPSGNILDEWRCDDVVSPRDFLTERNATKIVYKGLKSKVPDKEVETKWRYNLVNIPRCSDCYYVHNRYAKGYKIARLFVILAFAVGMGLMLWNARDDGLGPAVVLLTVGSLIFYFALRVGGKYLYILVKISAHALGLNSERRGRNFPLILEHLQKGWRLGESPGVTSEGDSV